jgi:hypothetical protein
MIDLPTKLCLTIHRYGEASYKDASVSSLLENLQRGGANVYVRNYLVCRMLECAAVTIRLAQPICVLQRSHAQTTLREAAGHLYAASRKGLCGMLQTTT